MKHITLGYSNSFHHESEAVCEIKYIEVQSSVFSLLWGENGKKRQREANPPSQIEKQGITQVSLQKHSRLLQVGHFIIEIIMGLDFPKALKYKQKDDLKREVSFFFHMVVM